MQIHYPPLQSPLSDKKARKSLENLVVLAQLWTTEQGKCSSRATRRGFSWDQGWAGTPLSSSLFLSCSLLHPSAGSAGLLPKCSPHLRDSFPENPTCPMSKIPSREFSLPWLSSTLLWRVSDLSSYDYEKRNMVDKPMAYTESQKFLTTMPPAREKAELMCLFIVGFVRWSMWPRVCVFNFLWDPSMCSVSAGGPNKEINPFPENSRSYWQCYLSNNLCDQIVFNFYCWV